MDILSLCFKIYLIIFLRYIYIYTCKIHIWFTSYNFKIWDQTMRSDATGQICSTSRKGWGLDGDSKKPSLGDSIRLEAKLAKEEAVVEPSADRIRPCFFLVAKKYLSQSTGRCGCVFLKIEFLMQAGHPVHFRVLCIEAANVFWDGYFPFTFDWVHISHLWGTAMITPTVRCCKLRHWERSFEQKPRMLHPRSVACFGYKIVSAFFSIIKKSNWVKWADS